MESHLLQMRGLKLTHDKLWKCRDPVVASFTDAWIETDRKCESTRRRKSHLLQMRGLKPNLSH